MKKFAIIIIFGLIIIFGWVKNIDAITLNTSEVNFINQQINTNHDKIKNRLSWYKSYIIKKIYNENIKSTNTDKQNDI